MYKLVVIFAVVAACTGAPSPSGLLVYSAPAAPVQVVSPVVAPAVSSYAAHSVVHSAPVYSSLPFASAPVVHSVPLTYSSGLHHVYV